MSNSPGRVITRQGELDLMLSGFTRSELALSSPGELISAEKCDFVE
jgi:hypothetical protein